MHIASMKIGRRYVYVKLNAQQMQTAERIKRIDIDDWQVIDEALHGNYRLKIAIQPVETSQMVDLDVQGVGFDLVRDAFHLLRLQTAGLSIMVAFISHWWQILARWRNLDTYIG